MSTLFKTISQTSDKGGQLPVFRFLIWSVVIINMHLVVYGRKSHRKKLKLELLSQQCLNVRCSGVQTPLLSQCLDVHVARGTNTFASEFKTDVHGLLF